MVVSQAVTQPHAHLSNLMWSNPSAIHGMTMPMVHNSLLIMQAGQVTATTFPSVTKPFNIPYSTFGAVGSNYNSNPLVATTHVAHPIHTMQSMPQMTSVPSTSTFPTMPVQPIVTPSPITPVLATTAPQYSSPSIVSNVDAKEERWKCC